MSIHVRLSMGDWQILSLKCARIDVGWSCTPNPAWRLQRPQLLAGIKGTPYALIRASGPRCGQRERREKPKDSSLRQADWFRDGSRSPSCRGLSKWQSLNRTVAWARDPKLQKCNKRIHLQHAGTACN